MAVCLGSGRVDTSAGGCGWQPRHDREGSAGEARRRERDVEGVCVGCCMGIVRGVVWEGGRWYGHVDRVMCGCA